MNRKQNLMAGVVLLVAIAAIWMVSALFASTPVEKKPVSATVMRPEVGAVRFAEGAPQLSMIQAQVIESTPVPIADPMNARVAYDEDLTARVSVSFSGRITALRAATGDSVGVGQVLAEIDSPDFGTATADLNKARADEERKRRAPRREDGKPAARTARKPAGEAAAAVPVAKRVRAKKAEPAAAPADKAGE